ncbi:single hybrid motif-containing protein, partial [Ochromonadaceae sp. CCMP2298]
DFLSFKLYPKVFKEYYEHIQTYDQVSQLPTPVFFYGMKQGEEVLVEIAKGKTIIIEMGYITEVDEEGMRTVSFKLNGQTRKILVRDKKANILKVSNRKAEASNEIGSPLQGKISELKVKEGDKVKKDDVLFVIEAMKMETTISASVEGVIRKIHLTSGSLVEQDDLVVEL